LKRTVSGPASSGGTQGIKSPPEPAISLMIITLGPPDARGLVNGTRPPAVLLK